ncbi:hypothetical protein UFOVP726_9 [uncultured Caudovirales phage]|uniref:Uncharacterized protein n=1 Tax=uncultured Caudovirales phage TaxID=2100421 RepID=A0A6J5NLI7_9CAUD|nr:hypothetical protein UFOVP726_9 [uncultured Caudovirales phage]
MSNLGHRDWSRYEEAKRLRDSGLTLKQTGEAIGVSGNRVRQMLKALERREEYDAHRAAEWWLGMDRNRVAWPLEQAGFASRDDCLTLAANDLELRGGYVYLPGWEKNQARVISLAVVNHARAWLGAPPFSKPAAPRNIKAAISLLERHGYKVTPPALRKKPPAPCDTGGEVGRGPGDNNDEPATPGRQRDATDQGFAAFACCCFHAASSSRLICFERSVSSGWPSSSSSTSVTEQWQRNRSGPA